MKRSMDKKEEKTVLESVAEKAASILIELQSLSYEEPEENNKLKGIRLNAKAIHESILELRK